MTRDGYNILAIMCVGGAVVLAALGRPIETYAALTTLAGTVAGRGSK